MKFLHSQIYCSLLVLVSYGVCDSKEREEKAAILTPTDTFLILPFVQDSFPIRIYREDLELSANFSVAKNSHNDKPSALQFAERYDLGLRLPKINSYWDISIHSEIGYKYFLDSLWQLTDDVLNISVFRLGSGKTKFKYTYSLQINTAVLPSYKIKRTGKDSYFTLRSGGFFDPGDIQIAYGFSWRFWDYCLLNVSLATIKLQSVSIYETPDSGNEYGQFRKKWNLDYGFSLSTRISHQLSKRLRWDNQTRLFLNSLDKKTIRLDMNNQLRYKLMDFLSISACTRLNYLPAINNKLQLYQEFRLGFEWILSPLN